MPRNSFLSLFSGRSAPTAFRQLVKQADAMRDTGDPAAAAVLYRQAIAMGEDRGGIRKQLANMLKDSAQYDDAFYQYSRCIEANPGDADAFLQLGHLFKLQGALEKSRGYYARAAANPSTATAARAELESLDHVIQHTPLDPASAQTRPVNAGPGTSAELEATMNEIRSNWYALLPMFLNSASAIARLGADVADLQSRIVALELRPQPAPQRHPATQGRIASTPARATSTNANAAD